MDKGSAFTSSVPCAPGTARPVPGRQCAIVDAPQGMKAAVCSLRSKAPRDNSVICVQPARVLRTIMETLQILSRRPRQRAQ